MLKDKVLLYIEDEPIGREILYRRFKAIFKDVFVAEDGIGGLNVLENHKIDLIISDNLMPKLGGMELYKMLRDRNITIPFILTTASSSKHTKQTQENLFFIFKPISLTELTHTINLALQSNK